MQFLPQWLARWQLMSTDKKLIPSGDRPSGNIRGTRSPAVGRRGMIATSQTLVVGGRLEGAASRRQRDRRRSHRRGGARRDRAEHERHRRRPARARLRRQNEQGLRPRFDRPLRARRHAGRVCEARAHRNADSRPARRRRARRRRRLAPAADAIRHDRSRHRARAGDRLRARRLPRRRADGERVEGSTRPRWPPIAATAATFLPNGAPPKLGELFANPRLARSLESIAREGRDAFYTGSIARAIVADMKARNGLLELRDFADHKADWVEPISTSYRGYDLLEMPPSTQGFVALEMLNIMEGFDIAALGHNSADYLHVVSEAKRIAFADRGAFLADRDHMPAGRVAAADFEGLRRLAPSRDQHETKRRLTLRPRLRRRRSRRHHLPDGGRRQRQRGLVHPVTLRQLRRGLRRRRNRHHAAQSRLGLHAAARSPQRDRPAQAAAAHAGAGDAREERAPGDGVRRDGRRQPGAGPRANRRQRRRLRHARAGGRRCGARAPHGPGARRRKRHRRGCAGARSKPRATSSSTAAAQWAAIRRSGSITRPECCWADPTFVRTDSQSDGERMTMRQMLTRDCDGRAVHGGVREVGRTEAGREGCRRSEEGRGGYGQGRRASRHGGGGAGHDRHGEGHGRHGGGDGRQAADGKPVEPVAFQTLQTALPKVSGWEMDKPEGERMTSPIPFSKIETEYQERRRTAST